MEDRQSGPRGHSLSACVLSSRHTQRHLLEGSFWRTPLTGPGSDSLKRAGRRVAGSWGQLTLGPKADPSLLEASETPARPEPVVTPSCMGRRPFAADPSLATLTASGSSSRRPIRSCPQPCAEARRPAVPRGCGCGQAGSHFLGREPLLAQGGLSESVGDCYESHSDS